MSIARSALLLFAAISFAFDLVAHTCDQEVALTCPWGYVDGCFAFDNHGEVFVITHHVCIRQKALLGPRMHCDQDVVPKCKRNEVDACTLGVATAHICVLDQSKEL